MAGLDGVSFELLGRMRWGQQDQRVSRTCQGRSSNARTAEYPMVAAMLCICGLGIAALVVTVA
jgi:hypothetical protein